MLYSPPVPLSKHNKLWVGATVSVWDRPREGVLTIVVSVSFSLVLAGVYTILMSSKRLFVVCRDKISRAPEDELCHAKHQLLVAHGTLGNVWLPWPTSTITLR